MCGLVVPTLKGADGFSSTMGTAVIKPFTNGMTVINRHSVVYSRAWCLTNAIGLDQVWMRGTSAWFTVNGGSGTMTSFLISGATNQLGQLHLFGAPPGPTTNGTTWNDDLFGNGATNRMGLPRQLMLYGKAGTNYQFGFEGVVPVDNRDGTQNLYWIITGGSGTVWSYPGNYGTNFGVTVSGWSDNVYVP